MTGTVTDIVYVETYELFNKPMHKYAIEIDNNVEGFINYRNAPNKTGDQIDYHTEIDRFQNVMIKKDNPKYANNLYNEATPKENNVVVKGKDMSKTDDINRYVLELAIEAHPKTQNASKIIEVAKEFKSFLTEGGLLSNL